VKAARVTIRQTQIEALRTDYKLRGIVSAQTASNLKRVERDFGNFSAAGLTAERIDAYIEARLAEGDAKASINRTTQLLSQAYKLAVTRRHLTQSPHVRHLSEKGNERQGFVDPADFAKVLAALPDDLKDFCAWCYVTGQRKGEACSLTWSMIDGDSPNELRGPKAVTRQMVHFIVNGAEAQTLFHSPYGDAARKQSPGRNHKLRQFRAHQNGPAERARQSPMADDSVKRVQPSELSRRRCHS
jgi:integrase